jgi:hypothetical protein
LGNLYGDGLKWMPVGSEFEDGKVATIYNYRMGRIIMERTAKER